MSVNCLGCAPITISIYNILDSQKINKVTDCVISAMDVQEEVGDTEDWCSLSPACGTAGQSLGEFIVYNISNDTRCIVPFCPTILYYSIDNSK